MNILKRILKIVAYLLSGILLVVLLVLGVSQTRFFKDRARTMLVSLISSNINGTIRIGSIGGDFLRGVSMDSVEILHGEEAIISIPKLRVQYDLLQALERTLNFHSIVLESPTVSLARSSHGEWNIATLIKSSGDSAAASGHSGASWTIRIADLRIEHGTFSIVDSAALSDPSHTIDSSGGSIEFHRMEIRDANIQLNGELAEHSYHAKIEHCAFYLGEPEFELTHLAGQFSVTNHGLNASNVIVQTGRSYLELDASLRANALNGIVLSDLEFDTTTVRLAARNIDLTELGKVLPSVGFLKGSASLVLDADGRFGDLSVNRLDLNAYESSFHLVGNVLNLHDPSNLSMSIVLRESQITPAALITFLPDTSIFGLTPGARGTLRAEYVGRPLHFTTTASVSGEFGSVSFGGELNFETSLPTYNLTFSTRSLDISKILRNKTFQTSLFTKGEVRGKGLSSENNVATLSTSIDSSRVRNISLDRLAVTVDAAPHVYTITTLLRAADMSADLSGKLEIADGSRPPTFSGKVSLTSVDLAKIFNDEAYQSDLTLDGTISGSGRTIDDASTDIVLSILPSTFRSHSFGHENFVLLIDQSNPDEKHLALKSSIADATLAGRFDLDILPALLAQEATSLIQAIEAHATSARRDAPTNQHPDRVFHSHPAQQQDMDFGYTVDIKNLELVSSLIGGTQFNAFGSLDGDVTYQSGRFSFSTKGTVEELFVGSVEDGILMKKVDVALELHSPTEHAKLEQMNATLDLGFGSGMLKGMRLDQFSGRLRYDQSIGSVAFSGVFDSVYAITIGGRASIQPRTYVFDLDRATFTAGGYSWTNDQDVQVRLNEEGVRVMRAMFRRGAESISLRGALLQSGIVQADAEIERFDLSGINLWLQNPELSQPGQGFTGTLDARCSIEGSVESPVITFTAVARDAFVRQTRIGTVDATIRYRDQNANLSVVVKRTPADAKPTLSVEGSLPIDFALTGVKERIPDRAQNLRLISEEFDLAILDPLLAEVSGLQGTLAANVTFAGTPRSPNYSGSIALNNVQFTFAPNNVRYSLNGTLVPAGESVQLSNVVVRNLSERRFNGEAILSGGFSLKDYRFGSFDVTVQGNLLLMTDATRRSMPTLYGVLFTEIGSEGLNLSGTLDRPYLTGTLRIREASLTFPPTKVSETNQSATNYVLNRVVIDDTTKSLLADESFSQKFYTGTAQKSENGNHRERVNQSTLVDRLRYNLRIETLGPTTVRMIFTQATNEELFGDIEGNVSAINLQGTASIYGEITVSPRSYYNFFKRFDASGKLNFVGPWDNPELDVQAVYEGNRSTVRSDSVQQRESTDASSVQRVRVELNITGTRYEPKLAINLKIQREPGGEFVDYTTQSRGGDVQSDAISFILTGKFQDELTTRERENLADIGASTGGTVVSGFTSSLLSGILTDFLRQEFPFIRSAEFSYRGGSLQQGADVRLSGEAFRGYWRFGGKILNDIGNANVSYQLSLGEVFNRPSIRNLFLQLERKVESEFTEEKKLTNEARIYYRFSF
jgi:autotransporter translocation and assembly factor TamB